MTDHKSHHKSEPSDLQGELSHQEFIHRLDQLLGAEAPAAFARRAGIPKSTMHSIMREGVWPNARTTAKMVETLGCTREHLIEGKLGAKNRTDRTDFSDTASCYEAGGIGYKAVGERMRRAHSIVDQACQEAAVIPSETLRQIMLSLQFQYDVAADDLALLLIAITNEAGK